MKGNNNNFVIKPLLFLLIYFFKTIESKTLNLHVLIDTSLREQIQLKWKNVYCGDLIQK